MKHRHLVALAIAIACAGTAGAAVITYTFSGTASGTLGSTPFTNAAFTASAQADSTAAVVTSPGTYCNNTGPVTITIAGVGTTTTTGANLLFSNQSGPVWGFENGTCAAFNVDWLDVQDPNAATYNLDTAVGPSTGVPTYAGSILTAAGTLTLTTAPATFTAVLGGPTPPVATTPVPALGAPALAGLGILLCAAGAWWSRQRRA
ncbi:MAG: hypothetical protein JSR18_13615 [Proteobacteria bacterium]|nr:hypothetical protein [Pseudomonadota bacterium]